ncbi:MAG: ATP synthase subunit I [Burkholderiales bacterium]|nr:ATP synthase subunit I [Burkholderiales bacterium]
MQALLTAVAALLAGWLAGYHGAVSAGLGGAVGIVSILGFVAVASRARSRSAGEALHGALRAEAVKIVLMVALLWLVLAIYKGVLAVALIGTFLVTVAASTLAVTWTKA